MGVLPSMIPFRQVMFKLLIWIHFQSQSVSEAGRKKSLGHHKVFSNFPAFSPGSIKIIFSYLGLEILSLIQQF